MDIYSIFGSKKDSLHEPSNVFGKPTEHIGFEHFDNHSYRYYYLPNAVAYLSIKLAQKL